MTDGFPPDTVRCDACPVLCYIKRGQAGACDRYANHEGQLVDWIQEARESADGIILNAGALTHTSVAILDALSAAGLPVIEVHLSNIFRREDFRHHSYVSLAANGVICGLGPQGYELALDAVATLIDDESGEADR